MKPCQPLLSACLLFSIIACSFVACSIVDKALLPAATEAIPATEKSPDATDKNNLEPTLESQTDSLVELELDALEKLPVTAPESDLGPSTGPSEKTSNQLSLISAPKAEMETLSPLRPDPAINLCEAVGSKLGSVSLDDCLAHKLEHSAFSTAKRSLAFKDFLPLSKRDPLGKVLVIGGIHGDEFSSVSVLFKWMNILRQHHSGMFHWRFVPTLNPDGLLNEISQRQNFNGVDLNRNFPTVDWENQAHEFWTKESLKNPRRFPGKTSGSEAETQWLVKQIHEFKPDIIISMHAPYHLVDYDGPPSAPETIGSLYLRKLGVYPGSLGNYAGIDLALPIVTVELQFAGVMPDKQEINGMWRDLVAWLRQQLQANS